MKRIGISQRVVFDKSSCEIRDAIDQRWQNFAFEINIQLFPIPNNINDIQEYLNILNLDGLLFSGGNNIGSQNKNYFKDKSLMKDDVSLARENTEINLLDWALKKNKPVIGICKGMQFINSFFDGTQHKLNGLTHVNKNHEVNFVDRDLIRTYGKKHTVNSFHNYGINKNDLSSELIPTSFFDEIIESCKHVSKPLYGLMWHPERNNPFNKSDIIFIKKIFNYDQKF